MHYASHQRFRPSAALWLTHGTNFSSTPSDGQRTWTTTIEDATWAFQGAEEIMFDVSDTPAERENRAFLARQAYNAFVARLNRDCLTAEARRPINHAPTPRQPRPSGAAGNAGGDADDGRNRRGVAPPPEPDRVAGMSIQDYIESQYYDAPGNVTTQAALEVARQLREFFETHWGEERPAVEVAIRGTAMDISIDDNPVWATYNDDDPREPTAAYCLRVYLRDLQQAIGPLATLLRTGLELELRTDTAAAEGPRPQHDPAGTESSAD